MAKIVFHKTSHADVTAASGHPWVRTITFQGGPRAVIGSLPCADLAYAAARVNQHGGSVTVGDLEVLDVTASEAAAIDSALFDGIRAAAASALATRRTDLRTVLANSITNVPTVGIVMIIPGSAAARKKWLRALKHALADDELGHWEQTDGE